MSSDTERAVDEFLSDPENRDLVERILRHGTPEARAYALALLANASSENPIDTLIEELSAAREQQA